VWYPRDAASITIRLTQPRGGRAGSTRTKGGLDDAPPRLTLAQADAAPATHADGRARRVSSRPA
jgi:hypothetical protein